MKKQILIIRGGESFEKYEDFLQYIKTIQIDPYEKKKNWRDWIIWALSETHDVLVPLMPCKQNAEYEPWKIWFERHLEFITEPEPIIIGHSLGASFLLKWLSENKFPKKISQLHLIAPWVSDDVPLNLERIKTFKADQAKFGNIPGQCLKVHLWHSEDDTVVPYNNAQIIKTVMPEVILHSFKDRGHFIQPAFMELLQVIESGGVKDIKTS